MTETEAMNGLAEQYRRDGYTVTVRPDSGLAQLLEMPEVDLIATRGDEIVAVKLEPHGGNQDEPIVVAEGKIGGDLSLSFLREAESLQRPETRRAALVMGWTAFEAAAREVLQGVANEIKKRPLTPSELMQGLLKAGQIDQAEADKLRQAMYLRNVIVHGVEPREVSPSVITSLLDVVRKLKRRRGGVSTTIIRAGINREQAVLNQVEAANQLLDEVLGVSKGVVSSEWDLGKDGQGRPIITLTLSDFTGSVSGSFASDDLDHLGHVKTRLYGLWGDLLQIRTAKQLEKIIGAKAG